uniref:CPBP family intramembrane metalloprotease n=1 Tax=Thermofilum pendens TaxID=2269 RepID=A0A7J3X6A3_THEPE
MLRANVEQAWPAALLVFITLANFASPLLAYAILLIYSGASIASLKPPLKRLRAGDIAVVALVAALSALLPAIFASAKHHPSLFSVFFVAVAGVVEEMFFRGVLLEREGIPMQAFYFALAHFALGDPVSLVLSALLTPHYFLLGLTLGIIASRRGFHLSAVFHALYNVVSTQHVLAASPATLAAVLVADAAAFLLVLVHFHRCVGGKTHKKFLPGNRL